MFLRIICQALTYAKMDVVTAQFIQNHNTQAGTGKFIHKALILHETR